MACKPGRNHSSFSWSQACELFAGCMVTVARHGACMHLPVLCCPPWVSKGTPTQSCTDIHWGPVSMPTLSPACHKAASIIGPRRCPLACKAQCLYCPYLERLEPASSLSLPPENAPCCCRPVRVCQPGQGLEPPVCMALLLKTQP